MSFISSLEQAEDSYVTLSSDTYLSAPSRLTPTANASSSSDRQTASCPGFLSGTTLPPLTASPGADTPMSLAAGFHVKTSLPPGSEPALQAHARVYGQSSPVLLGRYDPATSLLRTFQGLLFEASTACLVTLPRWGWMHAGAVWGLMTSERPISANGSGYWLPTPAAISYGTNQGGAAGRVGKIRPSLETMARQELWPTPNVPNGGRTTWHAEQEGNSFYHKGKKVQLVLEQAVRLATQTSRDWRSVKASPATHDRNSRPLSEQIGGQLNPTWVEWLMNWPLGWTVGGPLNLQTYRVWRQVSPTVCPVCVR